MCIYVKYFALYHILFKKMYSDNLFGYSKIRIFFYQNLQSFPLPKLYFPQIPRENAVNDFNKAQLLTNCPTGL